MVGPNAGQTGSMPPVGTVPGGAAGTTPEAIPDIRRPDFQLLMQDIAQARRDVFDVFHSARRDVTISLTASPAPRWRHSGRNGRSVTPAIGATNRLFARRWGPMFMGMETLLLKNEARLYAHRKPLCQR